MIEEDRSLAAAAVAMAAIAMAGRRGRRQEGARWRFFVACETLLRDSKRSDASIGRGCGLSYSSHVVEAVGNCGGVIVKGNFVARCQIISMSYNQTWQRSKSSFVSEVL